MSAREDRIRAANLLNEMAELCGRLSALLPKGAAMDKLNHIEDEAESLAMWVHDEWRPWG